MGFCEVAYKEGDKVNSGENAENPVLVIIVNLFFFLVKRYFQCGQWGVKGGTLRLQQVLIEPRKTAEVHWWQREGGLLSLVNTCGEIGLCPPCMEAHPPWRVGPPGAEARPP